MYTFNILQYATNGKLAVFLTEETILVMCHGLENGALVSWDNENYISASYIRKYVNSLGDFSNAIITLAVCFPQTVLATNWNDLENNGIAIPFSWDTPTRFDRVEKQLTIKAE